MTKIDFKIFNIGMKFKLKLSKEKPTKKYITCLKIS